MKLQTIRSDSEKVKKILGLTSSMVGMKFLFADDQLPLQIYELSGHRYCQALMKAHHGDHVLLDADGINCPAAAAAFGFEALPDGLRTGKGLVGFGIVNKESTGQTMFEGMTKIAPETLSLNLQN